MAGLVFWRQIIGDLRDFLFFYGGSIVLFVTTIMPEGLGTGSRWRHNLDAIADINRV